MSWFEVYIVLILDNVIPVLVISAIVLGCLTPFVMVAAMVEKDELAIRWYPKLITLLALILVVVAFTPTTKQAAVIYMLPKIVKNEDVKEIPGNFVKVFNGKMKEWIDEMEEE